MDELLATQLWSAASVVTGPVLPVFEGPVPKWVANGNFFRRPRQTTGQSVGMARTGNVLILADIFGGKDALAFNEELALSGGEDTLFFMRALRRGHKAVWSDEAVVCEFVPQSRATARWLLLRAFRGGSVYAACESLLAPSAGMAALRIAKGALHIALGIVSIPTAIFGRHAGILALRRICLGAGMIAGGFGHSYSEYSTVHGE